MSNSRRSYAKGEEALKMEASFIEVLEKAPNQSIAQIALKYQVDRKALSERISGKVKLNASPGKKAYLSQEEEEKLVGFLTEMSELGFGYNFEDLRYLIRTLLNKNSDELTHGWHQYFMSKHPELALRRTEALDRLRARSMSENSINQYFELLSLAFKKCK